MSSTIAPDQELDAREIRARIFMAGLGLATIAASVLYAPYVSHGPVLCPFRFATGLPCPGCGLTRSFCAMAHGRVADAFGFHWLGPPLFVVTVIAIPLLIAEILSRRRIELMQRLAFSKTTGYTVAAVLASYHAYRLTLLIAGGRVMGDIHAAFVWTFLRHMTALFS
jgi:Protein of unknown function (DUF2752)